MRTTTQTKLFLEEIDREVARSRRALECVPAGQGHYKPHERSMEFGYLTSMVATIFSWLAMVVNQPELDIAPKGGPTHKPEPMQTSEQFLEALDKAAGEARAALQNTTDEHLETPWRLLSGGEVVMTTSRFDMLRDTLNHLAHHRGQMTVYLRLMGAKVPALYGPSADDKRF
jgi:uncharacterized damage-inducible protein DinB